MWSTFVLTASYYSERPCKRAVVISIVSLVWRILWMCGKSIRALLLNWKVYCSFCEHFQENKSLCYGCERFEPRRPFISRLNWWFHFHICFTELKIYHLPFFHHTLRQRRCWSQQYARRVSNMNLVYGFALHESSVALERPPGFKEVIGSNPVGDSDFFLCPTLVTCWSFHFHICFAELKIYHLSFFLPKCFLNDSCRLDDHFDWPSRYLMIHLKVR